MAEETESLTLQLLRHMDEKLDLIRDDFADLKTRAENSGEGLAGINQRLDRIEERLSRLEERLETKDTS